MARTGKRKENGYLTTGQAMALLPLSRTTISRYLDSGRIAGTKNPITGRRRICKKSLIEFAGQFGLKIEA